MIEYYYFFDVGIVGYVYCQNVCFSSEIIVFCESKIQGCFNKFLIVLFCEFIVVLVLVRVSCVCIGEFVIIKVINQVLIERKVIFVYILNEYIFFVYNRLRMIQYNFRRIMLFLE